jgi:hypothetical protein
VALSNQTSGAIEGSESSKAASECQTSDGPVVRQEKNFHNFFANLTANNASMRISVIVSQAGIEVHRLDLGGQ